MDVRGRVGWGRAAACAVAVSALCAVLAGGLSGAEASAASPPPTGLTTDGGGPGVQIDVAQPSLSWQNIADVRQSAYEIKVSSARRAGQEIVWDSGKVMSADETGIRYGGQPLASDSSYLWSVRVWDQAGRTTGWCDPAEFDTELMSPADWSAEWIGRDNPATRPALGQQAPAPLLRKQFTVSHRIADARLHMVGLGYYVAWINGERVGDQVLDPGPTQYEKTAVYDSYDVTRSLRPGQNAIGVMLGRGYFAATTAEGFGWGTRPGWNEPRLIAQLDLTYTDGSTARVISDGTWQMAGAAAGPAAAGRACAPALPAPPVTPAPREPHARLHAPATEPAPYCQAAARLPKSSA